MISTCQKYFVGRALITGCSFLMKGSSHCMLGSIYSVTVC